MLGGRLNDENIDYDSARWLPRITGGTYSCDMMNQVWAQAKCMDFIDNTVLRWFSYLAVVLVFSYVLELKIYPYIRDHLRARWMTVAK